MNSNQVELRDKKVLVVDDFVNVRKSIKGMLHDLQIEIVVEAKDANAAIRSIKEQSFDLILCDYNLGKGKDGARLLEHSREHKLLSESCVFVLITGEASRDVVISAMEFQPDDYLVKPFTMEVLAKRLGRWFDRRDVLKPLNIALHENEWPAVAKHARVVMEQHPRYRNLAQKYYVQALIQQGQLEDAESFLQGILAKRNQSWAQAELHRTELLTGRLDAAITGLKSVLIKDPNLIAAYDYLIDGYEQQKNDDELIYWLEQAISRAPQNISRQKKLVFHAQRLEDYTKANAAFKNVVQMAADTMHEHVSLYQNYIQSLQAELDALEDQSGQRELQREISTAKNRMNERFQDDVNTKVFSLMLNMQEVSSENIPVLKKQLDQLNAMVENGLDSILPTTALFTVDVVYQKKLLDEGDRLVELFRRRFQNDAETLAALIELQMEPVSKESKLKAKDLNTTGIELFKKKQYDESIGNFLKAIQLSPRHPGIVLNLVQSYLVRMKTNGVNPREVDMCLDYLHRLKYLPEDHYQYERYEKLQANVVSLS